MQAVALDLFSKRGYSGVSVRDICGELGLKESALYYHFKNKEELLNSLYAKVDQLVEDMRNAFDNAFQMTTQVSTPAMQMVARNFLRQYFCDAYVCKLISMLNIERMSDALADRMYLKLVYDMPLSQCLAVFSAMQKRKLVADISPDYLAKDYLSLILHVFDRYVLGKEDKQTQIEAACEELDNLIEIFYERIAREGTKHADL